MNDPEFAVDAIEALQAAINELASDSLEGLGWTEESIQSRDRIDDIRHSIHLIRLSDDPKAEHHASTLEKFQALLAGP
ncbi:hypothetical protein D3791_10700 [Glutamicibacter mishrai]|uniref:Uncharacterized protein n=1 Tax=Glutamicibacter mishrai TaxID=1775880 RepID=A0A6H0SJH3_9MICC|nr:hypothetical protein D3791_10700 [Glutamicibacter mishrai]